MSQATRPTSLRPPFRAQAATALTLALILLVAVAASAQMNYATDWWKIAGGGAVSTGGLYSANGTLGQVDAGHASGGTFGMDSGFWGILSAVQTTGAPLLSIARSVTNTIVVSWPSPSNGWLLQHNSTPLAANWGTPPETLNDNGTNKFIIITQPTGNRFFRLTRSQ